MAGFRRKLIEVALPLDAVNAASAREKSIRHGHPSTLHLWWARRPLAAARAVIFAQLVDDPSEYVDVLLSDPEKKRAARRALKRAGGTAARGVKAADLRALGEAAAEIERERLFEIIRDLVKWENTTNEEVLERARREIWQSWRRACAVHADHPRADELFNRGKLPAFHDPFAGGGSLPLEAQRLGLEAHASDLNPVAVLINKAMIEVPPRFAGRPPVHPEARAEAMLVDRTWRGAQGLAEDVRRYGRWMRDEAERRIGHLYPKVEVTPGMVRERPDLAPYAGRKLTVIAWLWARTVKSPNPAFADVDVPLASTFLLSTKKGKEAYVEPVIEGREYRFTVKVGAPPDAEAAKAGTKLARGANFRCVMSGTPIAGDYIKAEGQAKRMGARLMAVVAEGDRGRVYLSPCPEQEEIARSAVPQWHPEQSLPDDPRNFWTVLYGLKTYRDLFTPRQLVALTTFSDLVGEAAERVQRDAAAAYEQAQQRRDAAAAIEHGRRDAAAARLPDDDRPLRTGDAAADAGLPDDDRRLRDGDATAAGLPDGDRSLNKSGAGATAGLRDDDRPLRDGEDDAAAGLADDARRLLDSDDGGRPVAAGLPDDDRPLREGGAGPAAYADAVALYLEMSASRAADAWSTIVSWRNGVEATRGTFSRQALPMVWDYTEANPFSSSCGNWQGACLRWVVESLDCLPSLPQERLATAAQADATTQRLTSDALVSTDPPYYDNIGYADLSDFFYVWLRRSLKSMFPDLFATLAVPKAEELVATPYRHGSRKAAEAFFLEGMTRTMKRFAEQSHPGFPVTIYYAFKQSERKGDAGTSSTGWETFLGAVIRSGFTVTGTWPMRTEKPGRMIETGTNALASSIVLVCRRRPADAPAATRRECVTALRAELPPALRLLQTGNVAPVDLAQAAIGPGMGVYTRFAGLPRSGSGRAGAARARRRRPCDNLKEKSWRSNVPTTTSRPLCQRVMWEL